MWLFLSLNLKVLPSALNSATTCSRTKAFQHQLLALNQLCSHMWTSALLWLKNLNQTQWVSVIISRVCVSSHFSLRKYFNQQTFRFDVSFMGLFIPLSFALNPKGRIRRPELWGNILEGFSMTLEENSLMWRRTDEDWEVKLRQLDYFTMWGWTLEMFICSPAAWKRTADTGCYIVHTSVCQIKKNLRGEVTCASLLLIQSNFSFIQTSCDWRLSLTSWSVQHTHRSHFDKARHL